MRTTPAERDLTIDAFRAMVGRGEVMEAVINAPFGYVSRYVANGFQFTITSGPLRGHVGVASTFDEAVRRAIESPPSISGSRTPEQEER